MSLTVVVDDKKFEDEKFVCAVEDATLGGHYGLGWIYGFTSRRGKYTVFESRAVAQVVAERVGGRVSTVPQWNGHAWTWGDPGEEQGA